jgi:lipoprotein-anchoring transpeptidase ErfK/SrfK
MEGHHFSLQRLRSKAFCLAATLTLATLGVLSLPVFAERALSKTHSPRVTQTNHTRQQRTGRWIEVDLSQQRLVAWNGRTRVRTYIVSTGKRSTPTRIGTFAIQSKYRSTRMRGRNYNVPDVPYAMFYSGNYALHGAYWHNRFGTPVSHGCVNLRVSQARWLYNWAPVGTRVVVHQ